MSLELAATFAIATNRTLVLPPAQKIYLRGYSSYQDYFDFDDLRRGLRAVDYLEFRRLVDMQQYDGHGPQGPSSTRVDDYFKALQEMPGVKIVGENEWGDYKISSEVVFCFPACPNATTSSTTEVKWFEKVSHRLKPMQGATTELNDARIIHFPANILTGHFLHICLVQGP